MNLCRHPVWLFGPVSELLLAVFSPISAAALSEGRRALLCCAARRRSWPPISRGVRRVFSVIRYLGRGVGRHPWILAVWDSQELLQIDLLPPSALSSR